MESVFRNKILSEYSQEELEEEFIRNCEILSVRSKKIIELERRIQDLSKKLSIIGNKSNEHSQYPRKPTGDHIPSAFLQSQASIKEIQDQISLIEQEIDAKQKKHAQILKQINYFQKIGTQKTKTPKGVTSSGQTITKKDVIGALEMTLKKTTNVNLANRIKSAVFILKGDYDSAESMMKSIFESLGSSFSLRRCVEQQRDIVEREEKIKQLSSQHAELKKRIQSIEEKKEIHIDRINKKIFENGNHFGNEKGNLNKQDKDQKLQDLENSYFLLENEYHKLQLEKSKIQNENKNKQDSFNNELQTMLNTLRNEIEQKETLQKEILKQNEALELELRQQENQLSSLKLEKMEIDNQIFQIEKENTKETSFLYQISPSIFSNKSEEQRFSEFVIQMKERNMTAEDILKMSKEIDTINQKINETNERISIANLEEQKLIESNRVKKQKITDLENQLRQLSGQLERGESVHLLMPEYSTETSISFNPEKVSQVQQNENLIVLWFKYIEFDNLSSVSIIIRVFFFESDPIDSSSFCTSDKSIDQTIAFKSQNDIILSEFVQRSTVKISICIDTEKDTLIAQSEINLLPFFEQIKSFSGEIKLLNNKNQKIGSLRYEAAILKDLYKNC